MTPPSSTAPVDDPGLRVPTRPEAELHFSSPEARCFSEATLRRGVAERLGYDPFVEHATRAVRVEVRSVGRAIRVELATERSGEREGMRSFDGADSACVELFERTLLAVTIAIDPMAFSRPSQAAPDTEPEPEPEPPADPPAGTIPPTAEPTAPQVAPAPDVRAEPPPDDGVHWALVFGVGPSVGASFEPLTAVGSIGVELAVADARIGLALVGDVVTGARSGAGWAGQHRLGAEATGCGVFSPVFACAIAAAGVLHAWGEGFTTNHDVWLPRVELGARVGLALDLARRVRVRVQLDGLAHVTSNVLTVTGTTLWQQPAVSATLALALELRFE